MLETSEERVRLLKAGFNEKLIEELYIKSNNFKIINAAVLYKTDEMQIHNFAKN